MRDHQSRPHVLCCHGLEKSPDHVINRSHVPCHWYELSLAVLNLQCLAERLFLNAANLRVRNPSAKTARFVRLNHVFENTVARQGCAAIAAHNIALYFLASRISCLLVQVCPAWCPIAQNLQTGRHCFEIPSSEIPSLRIQHFETRQKDQSRCQKLQKYVRLMWFELQKFHSGLLLLVWGELSVLAFWLHVYKRVFYCRADLLGVRCLFDWPSLS